MPLSIFNQSLLLLCIKNLLTETSNIRLLVYCRAETPSADVLALLKSASLFCYGVDQFDFTVDAKDEEEAFYEVQSESSYSDDEDSDYNELDGSEAEAEHEGEGEAENEGKASRKRLPRRSSRLGDGAKRYKPREQGGSKEDKVELQEDS